MDATLHATQHTTTAPHPWEVEPDYARWRDPATGLMCCITRNENCGYLQGYVAMPKHHRLAKDSIAQARRGSVTFGGDCGIAWRDGG